MYAQIIQPLFVIDCSPDTLKLKLDKLSDAAALYAIRCRRQNNIINDIASLIQPRNILHVLSGSDSVIHNIPVISGLVKIHSDGQYCNFTIDVRQFNRSDVLLLNVGTLLRPTHLPTYRPEGQRWVAYTRESPHHVRTEFPSDMFNHTMTYSPHSDIPVPYGECHQLPDINPHYNAATNMAAGKKHLAAWFVSNCYGQSGRMDYVNRLMRYMPVHVYGKCGNYTCPKNDDACDNTLTKDYKFYLAFENSLCRWYLTEKVFRAYESQVVPVVMGALDYTEHLPKGSYLHVADYDSPRALARHMLELSANDTLYNAMFSWRKHYTCSSLDMLTYSRNVCTFLHTTKDTGPHVTSFVKHFNKTEDCEKKGPYLVKLGLRRTRDYH